MQALPPCDTTVLLTGPAEQATSTVTAAARPETRPPSQSSAAAAAAAASAGAAAAASQPRESFHFSVVDSVVKEMKKQPARPRRIEDELSPTRSEEFENRTPTGLILFARLFVLFLYFCRHDLPAANQRSASVLGRTSFTFDSCVA